jgi:hypothetical protein
VVVVVVFFCLLRHRSAGLCREKATLKVWKERVIIIIIIIITIIIMIINQLHAAQSFLRS